MAISKELLEILVCPLCKAVLEMKPDGSGLKCVQCHRVYPIRDDIPVMLIDEATAQIVKQTMPTSPSRIMASRRLTGELGPGGIRSRSAFMAPRRLAVNRLVTHLSARSTPDWPSGA